MAIRSVTNTATFKKTIQVPTGGKPQPPTVGQLWPRTKGT